MPPRRVVSLVPSITESLFELGVGDAVVGITDFCIYPAAELSALPRIGGTKNPRVADIIALQPDLVFANQEENTPAAVNALRDAGIEVVVAFPKTVEQAIADLRQIAVRFASAEAARKVETLAAQVAAARALLPDPIRVFVPIWYDQQGGWWMTLNRETFTHDLLLLCRFENVFATRQRRYPLAADLGLVEAEPAEGRDTRYPRVTAAEIASRAPHIAILPSEPYAFGESERAALTAAIHLPAELIVLMEGSLVTWPGTRLGRAIEALQGLHRDLRAP
jgi:ABC-type Fe3+-hydroxamate transport system substrate-binding protein